MAATVHLLDHDDPAGAFFDAARRGALFAVRTSGTSSAPRTVVRTTDSWVQSFAPVSHLLGIHADSRIWVPGPTTATLNLFGSVHARWACATLVDDPRDATHAHLTPTALHRLLHDDPTALAGAHVVTAGDRLPPTTYAAATAARVRVSHYYGAAELSFVAWRDGPGPLRAFPGVEVASRAGELWVRSPYLCSGYLEPQHQLRRDADGWATVGDRGDVDDDVVQVHGRAGGITTGGATVQIADIEHALGTVATGGVVVFGVPHPDLGEVVAAACADPADIAPLRAQARLLLSPAQRPRLWHHLSSVPMTPTGKIDRAAVAAAVTRSRRQDLP